MRVFQSRDSTGVRGINLADGDEVISMSVVRHVDATPEERTLYLKQKRLIEGVTDDAPSDEDEAAASGQLDTERYANLSAAEEYLLTLSVNGYGKRSSLYEYRVSGRGGKGIAAMTVSARNGDVVGSFPVEESDQIMLVTDAGKLIRVPVDGIRVAGRSTQGVTVFSTADDERVVSVERISDVGDDDDAEDDVDGVDGGEDSGPEAGNESPDAE